MTYPEAQQTADRTIPKILLVEDSTTNQLVACTILKKAGYTVDVASNGLEGVKALRKKPYDLVIMDVSMPEMDGLEATREVRKFDDDAASARDVTIIAMTANVMRGDRERCLDAGMNDYLPKPIKKDDLLAMIARWTGENFIVPTVQVSKDFRTADPRVIDVGVLQQLHAEVGNEALNRLIGVFLKEICDRRSSLLQALEISDLTLVERDAHSLKGSAGTFGAFVLQEAALKLEQSSRSCQQAVLHVIFGRLEEAADKTLHAFEGCGYTPKQEG